MLTDDNDGILDEVVDKAFNPILGPEHRCWKLDVSTKHIVVHTHELMKGSIILETKPHSSIITAIETVTGSGW